MKLKVHIQKQFTFIAVFHYTKTNVSPRTLNKRHVEISLSATKVDITNSRISQYVAPPMSSPERPEFQLLGRHLSF